LRGPISCKALREFDRALFGHIGFAISNKARAFFLAISAGRLAMVDISGPGRRYAQHITRMSSALAFVSDVTLATLGGALKRKEKLSGRLGDVLAQLYLASATIKHFEDQGRQPADIPLLSWACEDALYVAQQKLDGLLRNYPSAVLGALLRFLVFPFGKPFLPPGDRLGHQVAALLLSPSETRDRLTSGIFLSNDPDDPVGRLEHALNRVMETDSLERKLRQSLRSGAISAKDDEAAIVAGRQAGIITGDEAEQLLQTAQAVQNAVAVDEFNSEDWK